MFLVSYRLVYTFYMRKLSFEVAIFNFVAQCSITPLQRHLAPLLLYLVVAVTFFHIGVPSPIFSSSAFNISCFVYFSSAALPLHIELMFAQNYRRWVQLIKVILECGIILEKWKTVKFLKFSMLGTEFHWFFPFPPEMFLTLKFLNRVAFTGVWKRFNCFSLYHCHYNVSFAVLASFNLNFVVIFYPYQLYYFPIVSIFHCTSQFVLATTSSISWKGCKKKNSIHKFHARSHSFTWKML